jgi:hypothetical protein
MEMMMEMVMVIVVVVVVIAALFTPIGQQLVCQHSNIQKRYPPNVIVCIALYR